MVENPATSSDLIIFLWFHDNFVFHWRYRWVCSDDAKAKEFESAVCLFSLCKQCGIKFIPNCSLSRQYNFYGFTNTLMSSMSSIFLNRRFECSGTRYFCEIKRVSFVANCLVNCLLLCSTHKVKGCIIFEVQLKTLITALLFCSAHFKSN